MQSTILQLLPSRNLTSYVRRYEVVRLIFDKNTLPPPKYHSPRPEHCLTFYVRDAQKFSYVDNLNNIITYPKAIINGMHNIPILRYGGYDFWAIKVIFHPTALYRLTGICLQELNNTFIDAHGLWSKDLQQVNERLNSTDSLKEMVDMIETFLFMIVKKHEKDNNHPIDTVAALIVDSNNSKSIDTLARLSYLSTRQFIRKFEERVGVSPKMLNRIARFDKAYRLKNLKPNLDWFSIAVECGYYDYQHLVKDYKNFTHLTPTTFFEYDQKAPERVFGIFEK